MAAKMKWYLVNVQEKCEIVAKKAIEENIKAAHLEEFFGAIIVPQEDLGSNSEADLEDSVQTLVFFPGFIFVHMELNDHTLGVIKKSPQVQDICISTKRTTS